ncbi:ewing's tumor-associated antigen 1 isoform X2 [Pelobates fuscus]|uniref:ewing's tumor-associated antigen 1 isoform X2 n=1 Tax=Pelobates fuscus TaxID=191477 RepID=UPI002FE4955A
MSRRKPPTDRSRAKPRVDNEREEEAERGSCRETPSKAGGKLSRSGRPRGGQPATQTGSVPRPQKEEELCINKKTPKRLSKSKSWSTFNSPSNDAEQQHEIFWDSQSPTSFKLENGRRRQPAPKCAVDISDIVNRIAPQNEKPSNPNAAYLKMWIGEDAIPSTPVVARARNKLTRSKIIHTEDELMQLAKQFDRNLVETVHQDQNYHIGQSNNKISDLEIAQNSELETGLDNIPEEDIAHDLKSVSQSLVVCLSPRRDSQTSVDQMAEADLNALFDSSTQKYSGQLSQGLSDISTSSFTGLNTEASIVKNLPKDQGKLCEKPTCSKETILNKLNSNMFQTPVKNANYQQKYSSRPKETVEHLNQDDFEDDWGADFLEDDSFVMQITQNPSLIATPKQNPSSGKPCHSNKDSLNAQISDGIKCVNTKSTSNKLNNFKFVPRNLNEHRKDSEIICTNMPEKANMLHKTDNSNERCTTNSTSRTVTRIPLKSQINSELSVANISNITPTVESGLTFRNKTYKNNTNSAGFNLQPSSSQQKNRPPANNAPQALVPKPPNTTTKSFDQVDEWEDPKFSDEILDMFCESDSLWETNEEDDDDDLLYQVCDDVERLTQAQVENNDDKHHSVLSLNSSTNPRENKTDQGQLNNRSSGGINSTSSSANSGSVTNKCNASAVTSNRSSNILTTSLSGSTTFGSLEKAKNSLKRDNQVSAMLRRSTSVPTGGQSDYLKVISKEQVLQTTVRSQSVMNSLAPAKFTFTRIKPSQASVVCSNNSETQVNTAKDTNLCGLGKNTTQSSNFSQSSIASHHQPSLKRHLSESLFQSSKVFVSEDRNKKCSMEEIERKKQEALARRQMKARGVSYDATQT